MNMPEEMRKMIVEQKSGVLINLEELVLAK